MMCAWAPVLWIGAHAQASSLILTEQHTTGIRGAVINLEDGSGIEGAVVQYVGHGEDNYGEVLTGPSGSFSIAPLLPGDYALHITARKFRDREGLYLTVIAGQMTPMDVKMRKKTTFLDLFADRYGWEGAPVLLAAVAIVALIFAFTALWLARKAKEQS